MLRHSGTPFVILIASVGAALFTAACGGSSSTANSTNSSQPEPTATFVPTTITSAPAALAPGAAAQVAVQTQPRARCEIALLYASGPANPDAIPGTRADKDGHATWSWNLSQQAPPGPATIIVNCDKDIVEAHFTVT